MKERIGARTGVGLPPDLDESDLGKLAKCPVMPSALAHDSHVCTRC